VNTKSAGHLTAIQLTKLYRRLKAELDGLEATKESAGSSAEDSAKHLAHSTQLCGHLRKLSHALIAAEDHGRSLLGKALQNDILQMMVGIHIRLLNLDRDISSEGRFIQKEIAIIQQLVKESSDLLSRMADRKAQAHEC